MTHTPINPDCFSNIILLLLGWGALVNLMVYFGVWVKFCVIRLRFVVFGLLMYKLNGQTTDVFFFIYIGVCFVGETIFFEVCEIDDGFETVLAALW